MIRHRGSNDGQEDEQKVKGVGYDLEQKNKPRRRLLGAQGVVSLHSKPRLCLLIRQTCAGDLQVVKRKVNRKRGKSPENRL